LSTSYPHPDLQGRIRELEANIREYADGKEAPYAGAPTNLYVALEKPAPTDAWWKIALRALSPYSVFKLRPYGKPPDPSAQGALYFAAALITAIFVMEAMGWALLFNEVLNAGVMRLSPWTIMAAYFGILFGFGIVALEQAILTTDTTRGWGRLKKTLVVRVVLIGASAAITTQSYELLAFSSEIKDRVHQESVRAEMVLRYPEYTDLNRVKMPDAPDSTGSVPAPQPAQVLASGATDPYTNACPAPDSVHPTELQQGPTESKDVHDAREKQNRRDWLAGKLAGCDSAVKTITDAEHSAEAEISSRSVALARISSQLAQAGCGRSHAEAEPEGCGLLRQQIANASSAVERARISHSNLENRQRELELSRGTYSNELVNENDGPTTNTGSSGADPEETPATPGQMIKRRRALEKYLNALITSQPGQKLELPDLRGGDSSTFKDKEYGITNKVRVLYSELMSTPYQWPNVSQERIEAIKREFPLGDPIPGFHWYRWLPWAAVLSAAMFLPFVSLGYKGTLNENLNLYYIPEYQEQLGHVGATLATQAGRRFRERRAQDTDSGSDTQAGGQRPSTSSGSPDEHRRNYSGFRDSEPRWPTDNFSGGSSPSWRRPAPNREPDWSEPRDESAAEPRHSAPNGYDHGDDSTGDQVAGEDSSSGEQRSQQGEYPAPNGSSAKYFYSERDSGSDMDRPHERPGNSVPGEYPDHPHSDNPEI
jgi:hypothetical protein